MALGQFAAAGGTMAPFFVRPPEDVSARFLEALNQIRAATLPCEYVIPAAKADTLDFQKVNLHFKGPGREEDIPYVGRADRCDPMRGGWYYDVDPAMGRPARVIACPATCSQFKAEHRRVPGVAGLRLPDAHHRLSGGRPWRLHEPPQTAVPHQLVFEPRVAGVQPAGVGDHEHGRAAQLLRLRAGAAARAGAEHGRCRP